MPLEAGLRRSLATYGSSISACSHALQWQVAWSRQDYSALKSIRRHPCSCWSSCSGTSWKLRCKICLLVCSRALGTGGCLVTEVLRFSFKELLRTCLLRTALSSGVITLTAQSARLKPGQIVWNLCINACRKAHEYA